MLCFEWKINMEDRQEKKNFARKDSDKILTVHNMSDMKIALKML